MKRINLTEHRSLPEHVCLPRGGSQAAEIRRLLLFEQLPGMGEVAARARRLADIAVASGATEAMIGGAPYLMEVLPAVLRMRGIQPVYPFSIRDDYTGPRKFAGFVRFE